MTQRKDLTDNMHDRVITHIKNGLTVREIVNAEGMKSYNDFYRTFSKAQLTEFRTLRRHLMIYK